MANLSEDLNKNVFVRKCVNRKMLELLTKDCRNEGYKKQECKRRHRRYHVSWCSQSGCKAEVSVVDKPERNDFWCPTCQNTSQETCDATLANTNCSKADFCMASWDKNVFARKCVNRKMLGMITKGCRNVGTNEWRCHRKRNYHVTACDQSGCRAEFSEIARPDNNNFWCPTCQGTSKESCDASLANTTCPKADFCMALWDNSVFARKCVNRKMLELMTRNCRNVGSKEWECNRKRKYHATACDQSGCIAKMPGNKFPKETPFQCPTCPMCKSPDECENKTTMTKCTKTTRCMVLRVDDTVNTKGIFARNCIRPRPH